MGRKDDVTDKELAGLSDEEREALEAEEEGAEAKDADEPEAKAKDAPEVKGKESEDKADADNKDADEEKDEDAKAVEAKEEAKADEPGDDKADEQKADDAADDKPEQKAGDKQADAEDDDMPAFAPTLKVQPVEDYDGKMAAFNARESELEAKFKAGDLEFDAFRAEQRKVDAERAILRDQKLKADIAEEQNLQTARQAWEWEINRFYRRALKTDGIDYQKNRHLNGALDAEVKSLAGEEANADKDGAWILRTAHDNVKKALGLDELKARAAVEDTGAKDKADKKAVDKTAKAPSRKPDRKALPPDLGSVPQSDDAGADTGQDEFSHLDQLQGIELENALARLSKDKADRYLRGS